MPTARVADPGPEPGPEPGHQRMHEHEVDVGPDVVRGLVQRQLTPWAHLPLRRVASGGTDNALYRLGDALAVRLPLHEGAVGGLAKELRWLPFFAGRFELEIPEVVAEGEPDDTYPFRWAVTRWLEGGDALDGGLESLPDSAIRLGTFVRELQALPTDGAPAPGTEGFVRGMPLAGRDASFREWVTRCDGLLDVDAVTAVWDDALAAPGWGGAPVWLHADLLPGNVLVRDGRLVGVLDFGAMAVGDPAYDVTAAFHLLDGGSRDLFLEAVRADNDTVRRARGLVVSGAAVALPYYQHTNQAMVRTARRGVEQVLASLA